jgi:tetratricopeptide (TPR) repeat protein
MMAEPGRIVLATSIPPNISRLDRGRPIDRDYQKLCVQSWIDCGFRVLSVNAAGEIPKLAALYPDVVFVPAERVSEKKTPYIADLLRALLDAGEPHLGIINADILFEPVAVWRNTLPKLLERTIVAIQRHDTTSLMDGALRRYAPGFDCFFFEKEAAEEFVSDVRTFAMGLPWWDWWLPAAAAFKNRDIGVLERPAVVHLVHAQGYGDAAAYRLARAFASFVLENAGRQTSPVRHGLSSILQPCRELIATEEPREPSGDFYATYLVDLSKAMGEWHRVLVGNVIRLDPEGSPPAGAGHAREEPLTPARVFHRADERLWAGTAFESAKYQQKHGKAEEAGRLFQAALDQTPNDFEILVRFSEYLCQHGGARYAVKLLARAETQQPNSARLLNTMGFALRLSDEREKAISYFDQALRADSAIPEAAYNLAITLHELGRTGEAAARVDAALIRWPDDSELQQLRRHFLGKLAGANPPNPR